MIEIRQTEIFQKWLKGLRDRKGRAIIASRIARMAFADFGDVKSVGDGVSELRVNFGPGYRAYFVRRGDVVVVLLCGGDKSSQRRDIERAKKMAEEL